MGKGFRMPLHSPALSTIDVNHITLIMKSEKFQKRGNKLRKLKHGKGSHFTALVITSYGSIPAPTKTE
jgi:hypothetical protein